MSYAQLTERLAESVHERCDRPLNVVVMDGIPATGKSSLARALTGALEALGRDVVRIENDWFIARAIRQPFAIAAGMAMALAPLTQDGLETRLLARFLDQRRLRAFQDDVARAAERLTDADTVTLFPRGAFENLQHPRPWHTDPASRGLALRRGSIVLVEGTLTAATHAPRFPDLISILVRAPARTARARFLARNEDPAHRRNRAFSLLALTVVPFRIASDLLERRSYDIEVDLTSWGEPVIRVAAEARPDVFVPRFPEG